MPDIQIIVNGETQTFGTSSPASDVPEHYQRSILDAAQRGDKFAFTAAAQRLGSLEEAQALVRSKGIVRMADRITAVRAEDPTVGHPVELRSADGGETDADPVMFGHFAVFNEWTEIDSWFEGNFLERIAPGAFRKTFRENRADMRALFQHGFDPQIGDKPLGPIDDLREDDTGGYYEVSLLDAGYVREDVLPGLRSGLYGASFRFQMMRELFDTEPDPSESNPKGLPERTLKELRVFEFGPVTFPAYSSATAAVRSENEDGETPEAPAPAGDDADAEHHPALSGGAGGKRHLGKARRGPAYLPLKGVSR